MRTTTRNISLLSLSLVSLAIPVLSVASYGVDFSQSTRNSGAASVASESVDPNAQQFTSAGHALGFASGGYFMSNGTYALRVSFEGAPEATPVVRSDAQLTGGDASSALERVAYKDVWPGIEVHYDAPGAAIARSTWTVAPGADPQVIRLRYNRPVELTRAGDLRMSFEAGILTESAPIAWQDIDGQRRAVEVAFAALDSHLVGFALGDYRTDLPLVIDPTLLWTSYLVDYALDQAGAVASDANGNFYVAGRSDQPWGFPRESSSNNSIFVAKLDAAGTLLWNTFLAGGNNQFYPWVSSMALGPNGSLYLGGSSNGTWGQPVRAFEDKNISSSDGFVAKLDSDGGLLWNTFLGGTGFDSARSVVADESGNLVVIGFSGTPFGTGVATWGRPLQRHSGDFDVFVAKLDPSGQLNWSTFIGSSAGDFAGGVTLDANGNIFLSGLSGASWGSPVRPYSGTGAGFVAQLNTSGELVWNSFLGGAGQDQILDIKLGTLGNIFVSGTSGLGWGSPERPHSGAETDAFAAKLDPTGAIVWNTFLGDVSGYMPSAFIGLDDVNNIYVGGSSAASWGSPVRPYSGNLDTYLAKLDSSSGALVWNTFLGGGDDQGDWWSGDSAQGLSVDANGDVVLVGASPESWSISPSAVEPWVRAFSGGEDAFVAKVEGAGGELLWNTFLGSAVPRFLGGVVTLDASGNVYVAGESTGNWGTPLRAHSGGWDAFAAKIGPSGGITWNTFLGSAGSDSGNAIAVDASGNVYIGGDSDVSWGNPIQEHSGEAKAFAAKLDPEGGLVWNRFPVGPSSGNGIGVDASANVYLAGTSSASWGSPIGVYSGGQDAFVAKFDASGSLRWHTFMGSAGDDSGSAIAVGDTGNVYVGGASDGGWGSPVQLHSGLTDGFAAKLDPTGVVLWNTFMGGAFSDIGTGIAVDGGANVYVSGTSSASWGNPVGFHSGAQDAFAVKLDPMGSLLWNTFMGSAGEDSGNAIAVDTSGSVYVGGDSDTNWGTPEESLLGPIDAFAAKLGPEGNGVWNTFAGRVFGGSSAGIAVDASQSIYLGLSNPLAPEIDAPESRSVEGIVLKLAGVPLVPCASAPEPACTAGWGKGLFLFNGAARGKEKILAKFLKGPALSSADFGNPVSGDTSYTMCVYNQFDQLFAEFITPPSGSICGKKPCYKKLGSKGYLYKDASTLWDGLKLLKVLGGEQEKSLILLKAQNNSGKGQSSLSYYEWGGIEGSTSVTMQLNRTEQSSGGVAESCFTMVLDTVVRDKGGVFKALKK
jgi:hypothetical protein